MSTLPLVSIIINNYNYGRFVGVAIDSALSQTYRQTEVIVVDDGSTDQSHQIITEYEGRIIPVLKENGGQTSTFNTGFAVSRGEILLFLDADDFLLPGAVEKAVELFQSSKAVKVHWPLWEVDGKGNRTGRVKPGMPLPGGDLRELLLTVGPDNIGTVPTSGNAWLRNYLAEVMPLPEIERQLHIGSASADLLLSTLAVLFGTIMPIREAMGCYRVHGQNDYAGTPFLERVRRDQSIYDHICAELCRHCRARSIDPRPEIWRSKSWCHRLYQTTQEIAMFVRPQDRFILVDDQQWGINGTSLGHPVPFLEREGEYWGPPPDDWTAIQELERQRRTGVKYIVFPWTTFWWLDHYRALHEYLRSRFPTLVQNDRLVLFDLRGAKEATKECDDCIDEHQKLTPMA
jgi:glycosyltransferase involved in cell wall biosynthesis